MSPRPSRLSYLIYRVRSWALCRLDFHEFTVDVTRLKTSSRQVCLYCGRETTGMDDIGGTGHKYVAGMERPMSRLIMHNPYLKACPCDACNDKRARAAAKAAVSMGEARTYVVPMRKRA